MHHGCMVTWYDSEDKYPVHSFLRDFVHRQLANSPRRKSPPLSSHLILEFKIILRHSQNLSEPNFLIASTELFEDSFKTCLRRKFCCLQNQLICSRFFTKLFYWLSPKLKENAATRVYPVHGHFYSFASYRQLHYFPEAKLSSTSLSSIF